MCYFGNVFLEQLFEEMAMKRNWDLIREWLLLVESQEQPEKTMAAKTTSIAHFNATEINYHACLLIEAGLFTGKIINTFGAGKEAHVQNLTWAGHEFLDKIRSDTTWNQVQSTLKSKGLELTFESIKTAASLVITQLLT